MFNHDVNGCEGEAGSLRTLENVPTHMFHFSDMLDPFNEKEKKMAPPLAPPPSGAGRLCARGLATPGLQRQCGLQAPWPGSWAGLRAGSMARARAR